jgi:predicted nucleotidyltransferase
LCDKCLTVSCTDCAETLSSCRECKASFCKTCERDGSLKLEACAHCNRKWCIKCSGSLLHCCKFKLCRRKVCGACILTCKTCNNLGYCKSLCHGDDVRACKLCEQSYCLDCSDSQLRTCRTCRGKFCRMCGGETTESFNCRACLAGDPKLALHQWVEKKCLPEESIGKLRSRCLRELERLVELVEPQSSVQVYGSALTGLSLPESDLDVTITCPKDVSNDEREFLTRVKCQLELSQPEHFQELQLVLNARVPILKAQFRNGKEILSVDLSYGNMKAVLNSTFLRRYVDMYELVKPLVPRGGCEIC